ncbi:hypothetical protein SSPO_040560 [Streptomyces antimycoticus]|uniref:Uncharacterized protein n=1 Tax=Streptomyces antimycoticus TaxID=68175 RepID=A0A499UND4_9ACTN|nr:hypothetical protein SSPO_040560 [Streptomyces antimycoticus]
MRGEGEPMGGGVALHRHQIVLQCLGRQGQDGRGEAAGEQGAPLGGELADRQALGARRQPLEAVVHALPRESGDGLVAVVGGHGGASITDSGCNLCNVHCAYRLALSNIPPSTGSTVCG